MNIQKKQFLLVHVYGVNLITATSKDSSTQASLSDGVINKLTSFLFGCDDVYHNQNLL